MTTFSVGDMAQQFLSKRNGGLIKTELATLSNSLSSGKVADITRALGGETTRFSGVKYSLVQLDAYQQTAQETRQMLASSQRVLQSLDGVRNTTAQQLLLINDSSTAAQIDQAAEASRDTLDTAVRLLNTQVANRSLFGGASVDRAPLASAEDIMVSLSGAVGAITDPAAIIAIVDDWFDNPASGFATVGYLGDQGPQVRKQVNDTTTIQLSARADDVAAVEVLKGAALAALANDNGALDQRGKTTLLEDAGRKLFSASTPLTAMQARIGSTERQIEDAMASNAAQENALGMLQNNLERADPFDTAARLQAVQLQLETHFAVTARMSQLSLLRYI